MYYIYHILNKKIGVSKNPKNRTQNQQGATQWEILEQHEDILKVSQREQELQKEYGYRVDRTPYYKTLKWQTKSTTPEARGKIDWKSSREKAVANTDYKAVRARGASNTDYKSIDYKARTSNTDYEARTANTDYEARSKKFNKSLLVFDLQGNFIQRFESVKEAGEVLGVKPQNITQCLKGRAKTAKRKWVFEYETTNNKQ